MGRNDNAARSGRAPRSFSLNPFFRKGILLATHNRLVARVVRRYGLRLGGSRFVAGETLDAAVPVLRELNERGLATNTTLLGEGVRDASEAAAVVTAYIEILDRIAAEIRSGYTLGYVPSGTTPGFRAIRVDVRPPGGEKLKVRARSGYVAATNASR